MHYTHRCMNKVRARKVNQKYILYIGINFPLAKVMAEAKQSSNWKLWFLGCQKCQFAIQFEIQLGNFRIQELSIWELLAATGQIWMTRNFVNGTRISLFYCYKICSIIHVHYLWIICTNASLQAKVPKCTIYTIQIFCALTKLCACYCFGCWVCSTWSWSSKSCWTLTDLQLWGHMCLH